MTKINTNTYAKKVRKAKNEDRYVHYEWEIIANGIVLPKGHGRLIDIDNISVIELEDSLHIIRHEKGDNIDWYIDAPTIIEADREVEE